MVYDDIVGKQLEKHGDESKFILNPQQQEGMKPCQALPKIWMVSYAMSHKVPEELTWTVIINHLCSL